jgi:hypothetical protein
MKPKTMNRAVMAASKMKVFNGFIAASLNSSLAGPRSLA